MYVFLFSMQFSCVLKSAHMTNLTQKCTLLGCVSYSRILIFQTSWQLNQELSPPPQSNTVILPRRLLELSDFSNQFSFPLELRKIGIPRYMHRVTHLLKSLNQQQIDSCYNFTVNVTGNTVKYDSSAPCRRWCSSVLAKHFRLKCGRNDFIVGESTRSCKANDIRVVQTTFVALFFSQRVYEQQTKLNSSHYRR